MAPVSRRSPPIPRGSPTAIGRYSHDTHHRTSCQPEFFSTLLDAIADLRDRLVKEYDLDYRPHIHADAVIGWAWSVFNDYDFEANPLGFRPRTVRALASARRRISKLHRADSVGIDFHKTGFTPYISSLFLARDRADIQLLVRGREQMPYLFQSGERHPGVFTLETSRGGSGVLAAYANLQLFGLVGLRVLSLPASAHQRRWA